MAPPLAPAASMAFWRFAVFTAGGLVADTPQARMLTMPANGGGTSPADEGQVGNDTSTSTAASVVVRRFICSFLRLRNTPSLPGRPIAWQQGGATGRLAAMAAMTQFLISVAVVIAAGGVAANGEELRPIFDGKTLSGWEAPEPSYWSVEDGAITGRITKDHPLSANQYLVWKGGPGAEDGRLGDFELMLKSRVRGEGGINNGFQFRSRLLPDGDVAGYQVDNNLQRS